MTSNLCKAASEQATVPTEELTFLEISYFEQEVHIGDYLVDSYLVASIIYDYDNCDDEYWRVMINDSEIYRATSPALCYEYIKEHYYQDTLPEQEQLPPDKPFGTNDEIMTQICASCEKYGFELLCDGVVYNNDVQLGKIGCTDGSWWFVRADSLNQQPIFCDSPLDALWWLSRFKNPPATLSIDQHLQYRTIEQMNPKQLRHLLEYGELVAA